MVGCPGAISVGNWQHFDDFRGGPSEYLKWLMQICRNLLSEVLRRFAPGTDHDLSREELLDEAAMEAAHRRQRAPEEIVAGLEITATLEAAIEQLPPDQRQIVRWRLFDKVRFVEIGGRVGRSPDAVRRTVKAALQRLAEMPLCQAIA